MAGQGVELFFEAQPVLTRENGSRIFRRRDELKLTEFESARQS
jgi:hypothetical protein